MLSVVYATLQGMAESAEPYRNQVFPATAVCTGLDIGSWADRALGGSRASCRARGGSFIQSRCVVVTITLFAIHHDVVAVTLFTLIAPPCAI